MNLGAAWIYCAGPENPIRNLADKLNLTVMTTPYMCCQELYKPDGTLYAKDEYFQCLSQFYQVLQGILNASRTYEEDLSVYDAIIKVTIQSYHQGNLHPGASDCTQYFIGLKFCDIYHPCMWIGNVFSNVCVPVCLSVCVSICSGCNF